MRRWILAAVVTFWLLGGAVAFAENGIHTLYLIRHGQYEIDDPSPPDEGKALTPLGIAQARLAAARLRGMDVHFDHMYASTMTRARQTAMVIHESFPDLEPQLTRLVRECTPPCWNEKVMDRTPAAEAKACQERLDEAFDRFFTPSPDRDLSDIIVCHGNVIRYFVTRALKVETKAWLQMSIDNCSITVIQVRADGSLKVIRYNDAAHIPAELRTHPGVDKPLVLPGG